MPYKYAYLTLVTIENNNKFYEMIWESETDEEFICKYGRIDHTSSVKKYPIKKWNKVYHDKERKGYNDLTPMRSNNSANSSFKDVEASIATLINKLQAYSNNNVRTNYSVAVSSVTKQQLELAQERLNNAIKEYDSLDKSVHKYDIPVELAENINKHLINLYTILPRRMSQVKDYLLMDSYMTIRYADILLGNEQDILDSLATQVSIHNTDDKEEQTVLDALGLEVSLVTDVFAIDHVKRLMTDSSHLLKTLYQVNNISTQQKYGDTLAKLTNSPNEKQLFHSSRNNNWLSILEKGLMIRPSGAIHTGSMLGDGIYFANRAKKSIGYSSLENSYWTRGNSKEAYLAIYTVVLGEPLVIKTYADLQKNWDKLSYNGLTNAGYNSIYADSSKGGWLYNDEYVIFNPNQCSIKYLVEIGK